MSVLLGIDTSTPVTSIALARDGQLVAGVDVERARGHVEFLTPAILEECARAGIALGDLTGVATGLGPGLFTSMRVGIATAKTLAHTLGVPAVGISSLDLLAYGARAADAETICACVDARRGEVYAALYERGDVPARLDEYRVVAPQSLAEEVRARGGTVAFAGNGQAAYPEVLGELGAAAGPGAPRAADLLALAAPRFAAGEAGDPDLLEPLYVRRSDAEINWERHGVTIERPHRVRVPGDKA